jgi:aryl-alcohol dehydrogenase-like predicted oxidoreductase
VVGKFEKIAKSLGCSMAQLAIAWAAKNPNVSTVIMGASRLSQLRDNLGAVEVLPKLTPDVMAQIDEISAPAAN